MGVNDPPITDPSNPLSNIDLLTKANETLQQYGFTANSVMGQVIERFKAHVVATEAAAKSLSGFNDISLLSAKTSKILGVSIDNNTEFFKSLNSMTTQQANTLSIMSAGLLGASKLFDKIGDSRGLNTFSGQIKEIVSAADSAKAPFFALAKAMGLDINSKSLNVLKTEALKIADNFGLAVDQSLNFSRSIFDTAAKTGQLNSLFEKAGPNLQNLSSLSANYAQNLNNIRAATNITATEMGEYYQLIKEIPGALDRQSNSNNNATSSMANLEKAIKLAHGTGQEFKDVVSQISLSWENYGLTGDKALNMTARMSELNRNFGLNLKDTRGYITEMADTFKMLGDNTDSVSSIFNKFFDGLRAGGLGIKPAIETLQQMGNSLAHLTLAQKAFISARTGGPGGLLGGIQIEKDLAAGKSSEVLDKIRQAFTQQVGGRIITRDEVNSDATAREFTKQRALLQSGAFGNIAKSDEQAAAILKAFSAPASNKDRKAAEDVLKQTIQEGTNYEKISATSLQEISRKLDEIKIASGFKALTTIQQSTTPLAGGKVGQAIETNLEKSTAMGAQKIDNSDTSREHVRSVLGSLPRSFAEIMNDSKRLFENFKNDFKGRPDNKPIPQKEYDEKSKEFIMSLNSLRDAATKTAKTPEQKNDILAIFKKMEDAAKSPFKANADNKMPTALGNINAKLLEIKEASRSELPILNTPPTTRETTASTVSNTISNRRVVNNVINQNITETRAGRVAAAAGTSVQTQPANNRVVNNGLPVLNAPPVSNATNNGRPQEKQMLTANINVYVDGKIKKTQQTVNLDGGVPEL